MVSNIRAKLRGSDTRKLLKNLLSLAVLRGFDFLIPLITFPYIVQKIGIDNFGLIGFSMSLCVYFGAIIQYGFGVTATRDIARNKDNIEMLKKIYSTVLWSTVFLLCVCLLLFSLVVYLVPSFNDYSTLYYLTFISISLRSIFPIWFFQGVEEMKYITYLGLLSKVIFVVGLFILVNDKDDFLYIPALNSISAGFLLISSIFLIKRNFGIVVLAPKACSIIEKLKTGMHAFISQFAPNLYSNTAIFLLGLFTNTTVVGVFTAASKVIDVAGSVAYIFSNAFLPYISRKIEKHKDFLILMIGLALFICISLVLFSDLIVFFLYGDKPEADEISLYLKVLSPAILLIFLQLSLANNFLMLVGEERYVKNTTLYISVFSLLYSLPMIVLYGGYGAVFTLIFTRVIIVVLYAAGYKRHNKVGKSSAL